MAGHEVTELELELDSTSTSSSTFNCNAMDEGEDVENVEGESKEKKKVSVGDNFNSFQSFDRLSADQLTTMIPMLSTAEFALLRSGGSATLEKKMATRNIGCDDVARKSIRNKVKLLLTTKMREDDHPHIEELTDDIIGKDQELANGRGRLFGAEISTLIIDIYTRISCRSHIDRRRFYPVVKCLVANSNNNAGNTGNNANQWQLSPGQRIRILCTDTLNYDNTDELLQLGLLDGVDSSYFADPHNAHSRSALLLSLGSCLSSDDDDEWVEKVLGIVTKLFDVSTIDARSVNCFWRLGDCVGNCYRVWTRLEKLGLHFTDTAAKVIKDDESSETKTIQPNFQLESIWNKQPPFVWKNDRKEEFNSNPILEPANFDLDTNLDAIVEPLLTHLKSESLREAYDGDTEELNGIWKTSAIALSCLLRQPYYQQPGTLLAAAKYSYFPQLLEYSRRTDE